MDQQLVPNLSRVLQKIIACVLLVPVTWISVCICSFWLMARLPLNFLRLVTQRRTPLSRTDGRCVLISGGSTVQAVHLARHLARCGCRVLICEVEGLFGLARFSTACCRFYTLPRPSQSVAAYIRALMSIVEREKPSFYIPASVNNSAYFDGLAKPHLERLNCECWVPSLAELATLDDPLELLKRAREAGLPSPDHRLFARLTDASEIYEELPGGVLDSRHLALQAGPAGLRELGPGPDHVRLPVTLAEFDRRTHRHRHLRREPSRPWLILKDPGRDHFVTCTGVRNGKILANATCKVDETRGLVPRDNPQVDRWLERFFETPGTETITGHLSFRLAQTEGKPDELVPLGCRVGISLPYLCLDGEYLRKLWLPQTPGSRQKFQGQGRKKLRTGNGVTKTENRDKSLDKREALFAYWDPLPYCMYCYLQLPIRRIAAILGAQPARHMKPPLAVVQ